MGFLKVMAIVLIRLDFSHVEFALVLLWILLSTVTFKDLIKRTKQSLKILQTPVFGGEFTRRVWFCVASSFGWHFTEHRMFEDLKDTPKSLVSSVAKRKYDPWWSMYYVQCYYLGGGSWTFVCCYVHPSSSMFICQTWGRWKLIKFQLSSNLKPIV